MAAPKKYDLEFRDRAVRMYRDRLAEGNDSKLGARRHVCPASRSWQVFGGLKWRDGRGGQAQVHQAKASCGLISLYSMRYSSACLASMTASSISSM